MGPSNALAAEFDPLRLLITDLDAPPPCDLDLAASFGFGATSAASAAFVAGGAAEAGGGAAGGAAALTGSAAAVVGGPPGTELSASPRWLAIWLFDLGLPKPARAAAAEDWPAPADNDNTDFLSDAPADLLRLG